jgi:hypothetical protein
MKKFILLLVAFTTISSFSQEKDTIKNSAGLQAKFGNIYGYGITYEAFKYKSMKKHNSSSSINIMFVSTDLKKDVFEFKGNGIEISLSNKTYLKENKITGFYLGSSLVYGNIKFNDSDNIAFINAEYKGKYAYWSIFSPELGYDFSIGDKLRLNIFAGTQWQIEVKGKEDVDNKDFDNWIIKAGAKLSYDF